MQILPALIRMSALALSGVLLAPAVALAADGEGTKMNLGGGDTGDDAAQQVGASGGSIVRTIVGLAVVIGVIYGLTWVLKQLKASKSASAAGSGLETLATLPLNTHHSLHLVRAGDEIVLVGTGEQGVTPIRTYTEAEARALGLFGPSVDGVEPDVPAEVFGTETRRGRLIDELRRRTVIK
jgi:flagellar protein FliO/FliZ